MAGTRSRNRPHREDATFRAAEQGVWVHYGRPDPHEHLIPVPEWGINARAMVHGEGRTVMLVHGLAASGASMVALAGALDAERVIVLDRPGCGLAEPLDWRRLEPDEYRASVVAVLSAVVEALGDGPVDIVGNSLGGAQSMIFAAARPDLVRSVVLDGAPAFQGMVLIPILRLAAIGPMGKLAVRQWPEPEGARETLIDLGHEATMRSGKLEGPHMDLDLAVGRYTDTRRNELALLKKIHSIRRLRPEWTEGPETIAAVEVPTLWMIGTEDPFAPPEMVREWSGHARRSTFHVLEGCGHAPYLDDADRDVRLMREFWGDLH